MRAFSVGADDFITKPFDSTELVARIKAIVRRSKGHSQPTLRVGALQLNLENREVLVSGEPAPAEAAVPPVDSTPATGTVPAEAAPASDTPAAEPAPAARKRKRS